MASIFKSKTGDVPRTVLDDDTKHYAAIGRFVTMYAAAEAGSHIALRKMSGLDDEFARYLWGGKRLSDITGAIRKLLPKSGISEVQKEIINNALGQLSILSDARGKLVHQILQVVDDDTVSTSNDAQAKALETAQIDTFTLNELSIMEHDCFLISRQFTLVSDPAKIANDLRGLYRVLTTPYGYKPKRPDTTRHKRRDRAKSHQRPPPPARSSDQNEPND